MRTPSRPSGLIGGGSSFERNEQRCIRSLKSGSKTITAGAAARARRVARPRRGRR